jgi:glycosyltransferase involved in cell wall biosynthesis
MAMQNLSLSIIMPALNEENNIVPAVQNAAAACQKYGIEYEIIVINDGSTDKTGQCLQNLSDTNLKVINHDKTLGIGKSFFDGVRAAEKTIVVMFPGDNENNPESALAFFYLLKDVDITVPFIFNLEVRSKPRRLISSIYRFIINMSFGVNFTYTNGTVLYRKSILKNLNIKSSGFFYQAELLIKLVRKGYLYAQVPNFLQKRESGKSKALTLKSFIDVVKSYLRLVWQIHITRIEENKQYKAITENSVTYAKMHEK